jgi:hypothetical protein
MYMLMNSITKRLLVLICITLFVTCKKKDNPVVPIVKVVPVVPVPVPVVPVPVPVVPPPIVPTPPTTEDKLLIPIKLELDKEAITFKYLQQTGNLTEIESSNGIKELYYYTENSQLKQYDRYTDGVKKYAVYYIRDKQGNVIQANQNKVEYNGALLTPTGTYKIEYNMENKISQVTWYDNNDRILSQSRRTYTTLGAVLKVSTTGQNAAVFNYIYDNKNGWCKQVNYNQIISIESLNTLFLSSAGNMISSTDESGKAAETSNVYTYNLDNYPSSWIHKDPEGTKTTFKVTYR